MQDQRESNNRIIRIGEVMARTSISRSQIYHLAAIGKFPKSIPLVPGGTSVGWVLSEVEDFINERIAARTQGEKV